MSTKGAVIIDRDGRRFSNDLTSCEAWDALLAYLADRGLTEEKLIESFNTGTPISLGERIEDVRKATGLLDFVEPPPGPVVTYETATITVTEDGWALEDTVLTGRTLP